MEAVLGRGVLLHVWGRRGEGKGVVVVVAAEGGEMRDWLVALLPVPLY